MLGRLRCTLLLSTVITQTIEPNQTNSIIMWVVIVHQSPLILVIIYIHQASFIPFDLRPVKDSGDMSLLLLRNSVPCDSISPGFMGAI